MKFDRINVNRLDDIGYVIDKEKFLKFVNDFRIIGVHWSQPTNISASYFLRLLQDGSKARARGFGKQSYIENDESSNQLSEFYDKLFDHGALWKLENGRVICTAMPYSDEKIVLDEFERLKNKYEYPDDVILNFLDKKYKFRRKILCCRNKNRSWKRQNHSFES